MQSFDNTIKPGDLCLAFHPRLAEPQECIAVEFIKVGIKTTLTVRCGHASGVTKSDIWIVDRVLNYRIGELDCNGVPAAYIMKISGHKEDKQDTIVDLFKSTAKS